MRCFPALPDFLHHTLLTHPAAAIPLASWRCTLPMHPHFLPTSRPWKTTATAFHIPPLMLSFRSSIFTPGEGNPPGSLHSPPPIADKRLCSPGQRFSRDISFLRGLWIRNCLLCLLGHSHAKQTSPPPQPLPSPLPPFHCHTHPLDPSARINQFSIPGEIIQILCYIYSAACPCGLPSWRSISNCMAALVCEYHFFLRLWMADPWHACAMFQKHNGFISMCLYLSESILSIVTSHHASVTLWQIRTILEKGTYIHTGTHGQSE